VEILYRGIVQVGEAGGIFKLVHLGQSKRMSNDLVSVIIHGKVAWFIVGFKGIKMIVSRVLIFVFAIIIQIIRRILWYFIPESIILICTVVIGLGERF
jgi:hypothetical protein